MHMDDAESVAKFVAARIERMRTAHELTQAMLSRSFEQIAASEALLKREIPAVWHPDPTGTPPIRAPD